MEDETFVFSSVVSFLLAINLFGLPYQLPTKSDDFDPRNPFEKFTTLDSFGRAITFYLSKPTGEKSVPIALIIPGSGGQSIWYKREGQVMGGLQYVALQAAKGKSRILVVEKPGIPFAFEPPAFGAAEGAPKEFLQEHTLARWTEANRAAVFAARLLPGSDASKLLVCGHSEGALVAAKLAAENPQVVTHVASLAGGGPSQLYDFTILLPAGQAEKMWSEIQKDPMSTEKFVLGHPYRRWSTFCAESSLEHLSRYDGFIFAAHGSEDQAVPIQGFDVLIAELRAKGKKLEAVRIEKGDHGFRVPGEEQDGFNAMIARVMSWFLPT